MNRWRILLLSGLTLLISHLFVVVQGSGEIRQRSDGCGRNPLIAIATVFGSGSLNLNDVLRAVKADPSVWSEMQVLLRRYDDCIRAGDGLHFKRSGIGGGGGGGIGIGSGSLGGVLFPLPTSPPNAYMQLQSVYDGI